MNSELLNRFLIVFSTLFVIVDPVGVVTTFISLTRGFSEEERKRIVLKAVSAGSAVLILFSLFGTYLFQLLNLNMAAFKAGGGLLLLLTALEMLRGRADTCKCSSSEMGAPEERDDISYVPVAVPLLAGPGAITSVMVFSTDHSSDHLLHFSLISGAVVLTFAISFFVLRASGLVSKALGRSGVSVVQRLMGLLLAALSIQLTLDGATKLIVEISTGH